MKKSCQILALAVVLLPACESPGVLGDGNKVTESRAIESFDRVENRSALDVYIDRGRAEHVEVTIDQNLQRHVKIEVRDHTLIVDAVRELDFEDTGRVDVALPKMFGARLEGSGNLIVREPADPVATSIEVSGSGRAEICGGISALELALSGSGEISVCDGEYEGVSITSSGSGRIEIAGACANMDAEVSGSGDVDARGLWAGDATLSSSGSGQIASTVDGTAWVSLSGSGDIDLWGHHRLEVLESSGSGVIIRH